MEDELNIDPRETDHLDDYDMGPMMNYARLKNQLRNLGFTDASLLESIWKKVIHDKPVIFTVNYGEFVNSNEFRTWFEYEQNHTGDYQLKHFESLFSIGGGDINRLFQPDITRSEALAVLYKGRLEFDDPLTQYSPMNRKTMEYYVEPEGVEKIINQLLNTTNQMNTENLSYLQKQLLNLGFGEKLNEELEKNIKSGKKEFTLIADREYNKQNVDYILHYKAGDQNDMYFFNKYDASLRGKEMQQTFYINKGSGVTAKEAYNLMEGRAVHKQLENLEGEKYHAWIVIDKENKTENGNYKLRPFTEGWNYKPERAIDKLAIVGIDEQGAREKLMKSLEKGNRHQVTAMKDGKEVKLFLEANPAEHRVNLTNWKGEAQQLEHYKKPELKNDHQKDQKQAQSEEDAPAKKLKRGTKMKI
ncbi:MAG: hypothetical protein JST50_02490 [Bacteroidetes bacterium]|nr:hypothetical protein [Bacteroidota bacterium]